MKKALIIAAALSALSLPALAQGLQPSGTRAGGPGQVGAPGELGGGVPGAKPKMMMRRKPMMRKKMRRMKKKM